MNKEFDDRDIQIRIAVDELQRKIQEEQMNSAGHFILNQTLTQLFLQLDLIQRNCKHGQMDEEGCCAICSKYIKK